MTAYAALHLVPVEVVERLHADRGTYRQWVWQNIRSSSVRSARMHSFDDFVRRWPRLQDWFAAPLRQRLLDDEGCVRGQNPHGGASVIMPYLSYLSLVRSVGLDYDVLLGRTFASPFTNSVHNGGLGVDVELFNRHVARLVQLGYAPTSARQQLKWPLGRMLLHRGDPDLRALSIDDLDELRDAVDRFTARQRMEPLRDFYARPRSVTGQPDSAQDYFRTAIARMHAAQVLLFHVGQSTGHPPGASTREPGPITSRRRRHRRRSAP